MADTFNVNCMANTLPGSDADVANVALAAKVQHADTGKEYYSVALNYTDLSTTDLPGGSGKKLPPGGGVGMLKDLWANVVKHMQSKGYTPIIEGGSAPTDNYQHTTWSNIDVAGVDLLNKLVAQMIATMANMTEHVAKVHGKPFKSHDSKMTVAY